MNLSKGLSVKMPQLIVNITISICLLVFAFAVPAFSETDSSSMVSPHRFSLPAEEVKQVITAWSEAAGYAIVSMDANEMRLRLSKIDGDAAIEVFISPDSPLGADVSFSSGENAKAVKELLQDIQSYADHAADRGRAASGSDLVPDSVKEKTRAVVCIRALGKDNQENQFSGVVIGHDGLILTTAHGLKHASSMTVMFNDGKTFQGRQVRVDMDCDLALIRVDRHLPFAIPIPRTGVLPDMATPLYAAGCPDNGGVVVTSGVITAPPVKVNGFLLYQVNMPIHPGSSGSPIFDQTGRFTAVIKARFRGTDTIGFLIPLSTLNAFWESSDK